MENQYPVRFLNRMKNMLNSNEYVLFVKSLHQDSLKGLRVNTLKISSDDFLSFSPFTLSQVPWVENGFYYSKHERPGKHPYHEAGLYYIQEPSAMAVAPLLAPEPGEKVLDLAAAPGGKTGQLAEQMMGKGLLVANEIVPSRAKILAENVERLGIANALVTSESPQSLAKRLPQFFDRILLDAPCSGEGMFRKDEQARIEWSEENVWMCARRQAEILNCAAQMLRPGGTLIYSTCTFSSEENEQLIEEFLDQHPGFSLIPLPLKPGFSRGNPEWTHLKDEKIKGTVRVWPHIAQGEGHFMALLKKESFSSDEEEIQSCNGMKKKHRNAKSRDKSVKSALKKTINVFKEFCTAFDWNPSFDLSIERITLFGEQLYLLPEGSPDLEEMRVLRAGLHLGTLKKNRFEPSHALALSFPRWAQVPSVSYRADQKEIESYLKGETLPSPGDNGWVLIQVDGFPLGWGKRIDGIIKNHYPKGLRKNI